MSEPQAIAKVMVKTIAEVANTIALRVMGLPRCMVSSLFDKGRGVSSDSTANFR